MPDVEPTAASTGFLVRNEKTVLGVLVAALLVVGTVGALDDPFDDVPEADPFEFEQEFEGEFPEPPEFDVDDTIPEFEGPDFEGPDFEGPDFEGPDFDFDAPPPIEVPAPDYQF